MIQQIMEHHNRDDGIMPPLVNCKGTIIIRLPDFGATMTIPFERELFVRDEAELRRQIEFLVPHYCVNLAPATIINLSKCRVDVEVQVESMK